MTRRHTLHAPTAGIRVAVTTATTIVLDPGPDDRARWRNLARERFMTAGAVVLAAVSVELLRASEPHDRPWTLTAGLLLGALVCHAARPACRTVPAELVELLEPLRATAPERPGEIHRLVWEGAGLMAAEVCPRTPPCPAPARRVVTIQRRLRLLIDPAVQSVPAPADVSAPALPDMLSSQADLAPRLSRLAQRPPASEHLM
jgi:hypothetical protein